MVSVIHVTIQKYEPSAIMRVFFVFFCERLSPVLLCILFRDIYLEWLWSGLQVLPARLSWHSQHVTMLKTSICRSSMLPMNYRVSKNIILMVKTSLSTPCKKVNMKSWWSGLQVDFNSWFQKLEFSMCNSNLALLRSPFGIKEFQIKKS